jgi:hypothetical protein
MTTKLVGPDHNWRLRAQERWLQERAAEALIQRIIRARKARDEERK